MIYKHYAVSILWVFLVCLAVGISTPVLGGETGQGGGASESPQGTLLGASGDLTPDNTADPEVSASKDPALVAAMETVQQARMQLLLLPPDTQAFQKAELRLDQAEQNLDRTFSRVAGISTGDILAMREDGLQWIDILQLLNVDPAVLGLDTHYAQCPTDRMPLVADQSPGDTQGAEYLQTARSLKGGLAKGHGVSVAGHSLQGQGLGAHKVKAGTGGPDSDFANQGGFQDLGKRAGLGDGSGNDGPGKGDGTNGGGMNGRNGDGPGGSSGGKDGKSV